MSFKASFENLDIQTLSQKVRRLEYWFEQGHEYITDERLDNYNFLKERIKELYPEYKFGDNHIFSINVDNTQVIGKITKLERFYIEVDILYPYINWKNYRVISGPGRMTPNHFLKIYRERSEQMLLESYNKLKIIDESIDRIIKVYNDITIEIQLVSKLKNDPVKERIVSKLNDWFFHDFIFTSSVTGMIASYSERAMIEEIIKAYIVEKKKIYL